IAARLEARAKAPNPPLIISGAVAEMVGDAFTVFGGKAAELKGVGVHKLYSIREATGRSR
ncbi:MAG: hypothetical protein MI892_30145, partial [Desulfobacterales bacterium]|nr:hypothetical protein [Desulfobacterales bacterium]